MKKEQSPIKNKKLISEFHSFVYEIQDEHGTRTVEETQKVEIENSNSNQIGFNYEESSVQKTGKRTTKNKQTPKAKKN
jgi:hypothetical protein